MAENASRPYAIEYLKARGQSIDIYILHGVEYIDEGYVLFLEMLIAELRARRESPPKIGDLVVSATAQEVEWGGLPTPWYWSASDAVGMKNEKIVVLMSANDIRAALASSANVEGSTDENATK